MKSMLMKVGSLAVLLALSLMLITQQSSSAPNQVKSYSLSGSLCGSYEPLDPLNPLGEWAWKGTAVISFANQPPKFATFVDRNNWSGTRGKGGQGLYGSETITFTFDDGSGTFQATVDFYGTPAATPLMYNVQERGPIGNGTGDYALANGMLTTHGTAIAIPAKPGAALTWMAELHGSISY